MDPFGSGGGGELANRELVRAGRERGHVLELFALWPKPRLPRVSGIDGWLLVDVHNVPRHQHRVDQRLLRRIPWTSQNRFSRVLRRASREAYVHMDHAYVDTCNQPYLPCNGTEPLNVCPFARGKPCFRLETAQLYSNARSCVFQSPLHERVITRLHPGIRGRTFVNRPSLDPSPFLNARSPERDIEWLWVGAMSEAKGTDRIRARPGLTIVTPRVASPVPEGANVVTGLGYEDMPAVFGRARRFIFNPRWPEPFGRTVAEAALAGCELQVQGEVGALSFERDLADPGFYLGACTEFWEHVERVLS